MPGPAPNPNARRRNDKDAWRTLPHRCDTPAPSWPKGVRKPAGLAALWAELWALPVAELWHEQGAVRLVARYAALSLDRQLDATRQSAELRLLEASLGLSPIELRKARYTIAPAPASDEKGAGVASIDDARLARLRAV